VFVVFVVCGKVRKEVGEREDILLWLKVSSADGSAQRGI